MKRPLIIAEAGVNHNGSLESAIELVKVAKDAGADVIKFQTFSVNELVNGDAELAPYQREGTKFDRQRAMLESLALTAESFFRLREVSDEVGIEFMSTAFDVGSLELLRRIGIARVKIPSGEITNKPLLEAAAASELPIILSTGMSTELEIESALDVIDPDGSRASPTTLLQCTTAYPTPLEEANLSVLPVLKTRFQREVGFSDHTNGDVAAIVAVALGATIIEKHLTLDRSLPGPDHKASLDPDGFRRYVRSIEAATMVLGSPTKSPTKSELENLAVARKSIFLRRDVGLGQVIVDEDLVALRPGNGVSPMEWSKIVGSVASRSFIAGDQFEW